MATKAPDMTGEIRDGRRLRGERTRLAVLEALLGLIEEGELHPTAFVVAERAGVALRTVYHHFEDVAELRATALGMQLERFRDLIRSIDAELPLEERIRLAAHQYRRLFEAMTPLRLAALVDQQTSEQVAEGLRLVREQRREQLSSTFAEELGHRRGDGRVLLDALDVLVSWDTWNYLRSSLNRPAAASERVLVLMLGDVFRRGDGRTTTTGRGNGAASGAGDGGSGSARPRRARRGASRNESRRSPRAA